MPENRACLEVGSARELSGSCCKGPPGGCGEGGQAGCLAGHQGTPCSQCLLGGDPSQCSACGPQWPDSRDAGAGEGRENGVGCGLVRDCSEGQGCPSWQNHLTEVEPLRNPPLPESSGVAGGTGGE